MKKYAWAVVLGMLLLSFNVKANYLFSQLNIRLTDSSAFTMYVDNVHYGHPSNVFNLNLLPGMHTVTVLRDGAVPFILFEGLIEMPYNTKVYAVIDYFRNFRVYNLLSYDYRDELYPGNTIDLNTDPSIGLDNLTFYSLKMQMHKGYTSLAKLKMSKNTISQSRISSGQLAEIIKLIEFETHRIELAKFAYPFTVDKKNYHLIYDSFSFESSVNELSKFVYEKSVAEEVLEDK